jgi:ABC-2 type transport system permease protein
MPFYILPVLISDPNGVVAQVFTYLPVTSVMTVGFQSIFRELPASKVLGAFSISLVSGLILVWLAAQAFHLGMLRYGKRFRLRELFRRRTAGGRAG